MNIKRITAWICIVLLGLLYLSLLILSLLGYGFNSSLFAICLIGTIMLPILSFIVIYLYGRYNDKKVMSDPDEKKAPEDPTP